MNSKKFLCTNTTWIFHEWYGLSDGQWLSHVCKQLLPFCSYSYTEKGQWAFIFSMSVLFLAFSGVWSALLTEGHIRMWCLWVVKERKSVSHSLQNMFVFGFVCVCILMIKTCAQLVFQKIIWLTEIRTTYANCDVLGLAVLLVEASLRILLY